ncbi:13328_t:CDS:2, partial [Dentiscutata erythropus]
DEKLYSSVSLCLIKEFPIYDGQRLQRLQKLLRETSSWIIGIGFLG